jgi:hypothetical protein
MLIKARTLNGYSLKSLDGDIGSVSEFYFDDRFWAVRYLVANTGNWLTGRMVLISPYCLESVNREKQEVRVELSKKEIEESPSIMTHEPVSDQFEGLYNGYYGYPNYWGGPYMWGANPYIESDRSKWGQAAVEANSWDRHLRSTHEVDGYHLSALDGEIGHVDDFILDETWAIRYLVIETTNWWPGKKVLISPKWIESISWDQQEVSIKLSREAIQAAPEYTEEALLTRDYEAALYGHYDREGYWADELTTV